MTIIAVERKGKPMDDLISREAVLNILLYHAGGYDYIETETERLLSEIRELPAAEPRKGRWLSVFVDGLGFNGLMFECSECGKRSAGRTNFCAYCGADMRGERNEP